MREPLTNEELRLGERLAAHLDAMPVEDPKVVVRSVIATSAEAPRPRHRRDAMLVLIAAALVIGGVGAFATGSVHLEAIPDTVVLPPGPSLPTPPVVTPAPTTSGSPEATPSSAVPVDVANGDVLIAYGGRIYLTGPTGDAEPFELPGPDGSDWNPQWSPDGQRIMVLNGSVDGEPDLAVWIMRPDGRGAEQLTGTTELPIRRVEDPAWSPDGTRIAMHGEVGGRPGIYVVDVASRAIVAETTDPPQPREAAWSPDGTRIAMGIGEGQIGVWTIQDGSVTIVAEAETVSRPVWTPDGALVFNEFLDSASNRFRAPLFMVRPDGTGVVQLTDPGDGRLDVDAAVSPDGSSVVFHRQDQLGGSDPAVCCGTVVRSLESGEERLLGEYPDAVWSPDGEWIASSAIDPAVAPKDPTSTKNEWVAVRVADGVERLLLVRNASGGPTVGKQLSWGSRPPR